MPEYIMNMQLRKKRLHMHRSNLVKRMLPYVRATVTKRMKAEAGNVTIDKELNNFIMANIGHLNAVRIKVTKDGDNIKASLPEAKKETTNVADKNKNEAPAPKAAKEGKKEGKDTQAKEKGAEGKKKI
ncbi:MAG: hypothetical protein ACP5MK_03420 [Candidatus Micrarchaeia archaeon]